jgi:hypothetical protein
LFSQLTLVSASSAAATVSTTAAATFVLWRRQRAHLVRLTVSHAAVRNMMCCAVAGQGAGVAAALAVKMDRDFDEIDISAVQRELLRQGARIS